MGSNVVCTKFPYKGQRGIGERKGFKGFARIRIRTNNLTKVIKVKLQKFILFNSDSLTTDFEWTSFELGSKRRKSATRSGIKK